MISIGSSGARIRLDIVKYDNRGISNQMQVSAPQTPSMRVVRPAAPLAVLVAYSRHSLAHFVHL